jgi:hypothetical protein
VSEAIAKLKARIKYLESQQGNRWAAFTDDELRSIAYPADIFPGTFSLETEAEAELEARAAQRTEPA